MSAVVLQLSSRCFAVGALALVAITIMSAAPAQAQPWMGRGSWCTDLLGGAGYDCAFYSFEQCWATASGMTNYCTPNPYYVPPRVQRTRGQVHPRRHQARR